jgi:peptidoglycan/xylan/chitin deacetylase (PgdA/CDA1 family)
MRWPSWLVIALAATAAHAQPVTSPREDDAKEIRRPAVATADLARPLETGDLKSMTDDPVLGKADKLDGAGARGIVAFTFDDGPNPETTPAVLEALEKYDIPATFFIVTDRIAGKRGEGGRQLLHRELTEGFTIGSHSVSHANLKHAQTEQLNREVDSSLRALSAEAGRPIGLFRPPYGALSTAGKTRLKKLELTEVLWSIDTLDWKAHNPDKLRKKVIALIEHGDGGVVLMHDVKPITAKIIAGVFDDLEAENCARLAAKREPIIPVSLHYFLKDDKQSRAIPEAVRQRTAAYKAALPERCANRPVAPTPASEPVKHAAN